jgi:lipooligosaccharide transport system permease protein
MSALSLPAPRRRTLLVRPMVSRHAFNVWRRNRDVFFKLWKTELLLPFFEPILVLLGLGLGLGSFIDLGGNTSYIRFLAPGVLTQWAMFQAVFDSSWGAYFRMENHGIYTAIASTPASFDDVAAGEILWAATRALASTVAILTVLLALTPAYGIVRSPLVLLALPVGYLMGLCFSALAICCVAIAPSLSFLGYFFNIIIIPIFWLSGGFFPLERMPAALQDIAWVLPLTLATSIDRHLLNGTFGLNDLWHLGLMAAEALALAWLAIALLRRRLIK